MHDVALATCQQAWRAHIRAAQALEPLLPQVAAAAHIMEAALRAGGRLFFCGNGGSAADAQHLAAEFTGHFLFDRRPLDAVALHANTSAMTAIGNDYGFEQVFARQLEAHGRRGDVLIALSTSGESPNVLCALRVAATRGMATIAMTGGQASTMSAVADLTLMAPATETPRIQELHILMGHMLCELAEHALCAADPEASGQGDSRCQTH